MMAYKAPSKDLGEKLGLDFLWNDWGLTGHHIIQNILLNGSKEESLAMQEVVWSTILSKEIYFCNFDSWWVIMGCVSQFNYDDIKYFCEVPHWDRDKDGTIENYQRGLGAANRGWVMSPTTMEKIKKGVTL